MRLVVRSDARTGRLVRSVTVAPRPVAATVIAPRPVSSVVDPAPAPGNQLNLQEAVDQIAREHELEPLLVHSVIRVESNYNPFAISPKGAQGLMQLVPETARRFGVSNSFNPIQNIQGGVRYLKHLLQLYNNNYVLALAAYNAGEGAVDRYKGVPPYAETQSYVYQVGKRLGEARRNSEKVLPKAPKAVAPPPDHNPIREIVTADGKVQYRTL